MVLFCHIALRYASIKFIKLRLWQSEYDTMTGLHLGHWRVQGPRMDLSTENFRPDEHLSKIF